MVTLHTIDGGTVNAINDALLYDFVIGQNGIATGATVTSEGALLLHIDSGWGVIKGRIFSIEAETISATPSTTGTVKGRLILQIDITNTTNPITFVTQVAATLPALQQEDINNAGTIFQLPIATYDVNEVAVSNLQMVAPVISNGLKKELLWSSANPSVPFEGQPIYINGSQYSALIIVMKQDIAHDFFCDFYVNTDKGIRHVLSSVNYSNFKIIARDVSISSDLITLSVGYEASTYGEYTKNNDVLIPYKIYGVK